MSSNLKWMPNSSITAILFSEDIVVELDGQEIITITQHYVPNINMIDIYLNGVYQQKSIFMEESSTTVRFPTNYLRKDDVVAVRFKIAGNVNFGNIRVVGSYSQLLSIPYPIYNEAALVMDNRTLYRYGDDGWEELIIPFKTQNIGTLLSYEKQPILDNTTRTYILQDISYPLDTNNMLVFIDGVKVDPSDYTEVDNKTITFLSDLPTGSQEIEFIVASSDSWEEMFDHEVSYAYNPLYNNVISSTITQNGATVKHVDYEYDTSGENVVREIISKGGKTITKNYSYDLNGNVIGISVSIN